MINAVLSVQTLRLIRSSYSTTSIFHSNVSKTKEKVKKTPQFAPVNIQGVDVLLQLVGSYKYLGFYLNYKLD